MRIIFALALSFLWFVHEPSGAQSLGKLVGWSVGRLVGLLAGCLVGWFVGKSISLQYSKASNSFFPNTKVRIWMMSVQNNKDNPKNEDKIGLSLAKLSLA